MSSTHGMGQYLTEEYGKRMAEHRAQAEQRRREEHATRDAEREAVKDSAEHQRREESDRREQAGRQYRVPSGKDEKVTLSGVKVKTDTNADGRGFGRYLTD
ncbi:hypothetical protein ACFWAY_23830 [Rhodococcus sp. NPDC059968]|uniref:hypothetical protein n=1 Tax=Rhodococcus sp. NPDC059968 TaxID=3347017 RepID=UPI00366EBE8A